MAKKTSKKNYVTARNPAEIAKALGLSPADAILMEYKSDLSSLAAKSIAKSDLTVNEIVKRSGVARSKVSAIKNGALVGISIDLFLRVIAAIGVKVKFQVAS